MYKGSKTVKKKTKTSKCEITSLARPDQLVFSLKQNISMAFVNETF